MDEKLNTNLLAEQKGRIIAGMWEADDIMVYLDQTWWLGKEAPVKLVALREQLGRVIAAVDAYLSMREAWDAERGARREQSDD